MYSVKRINFAAELLHLGDDYDTPFKDVQLMQFTGLKDKNGKEIYEGDILKYTEDDKERLTVPFNLSCVVVEWYTDAAGFFPFGDDFSYSQPEAYEVIGNVYETPDLLK